MSRKIKYGRFGLSENPVGQYVTLTIKGRQYLGEVKAVKYIEARSSIVLAVNHFNGEPWPFEPVANQVEVIY